MKIVLQGLHRIYHGLLSRLRNLYYRGLGVHIRGYVWMRSIEIPRNWGDITLEGGAALDRGVSLICSSPLRGKGDKLIIRSGTYVNRFTIFDAHGRIEIGRDCMIGPHCYLTDANHGTTPLEPVKFQEMKTAPVVIEDEVWIGAHVTILPGVRIGKGAVVGAGSVVTRDIPSHAVAIGVPADILRERS